MGSGPRASRGPGRALNPSVGLLEQELGPDHVAELRARRRGLGRAPVLVGVQAQLDPVTVGHVQILDVEGERDSDRIAGVDRPDRPVTLSTDDLPHLDGLATGVRVEHADVVLVAELIRVGQAVHDVVGPTGPGRVMKAEPRAEVVQTHPAFRRGLDLDVPDHDVRFVDRHRELHVDGDVRPGGVTPGAAVPLEGVAGRVVDDGRVGGRADVFGSVFGDAGVLSGGAARERLRVEGGAGSGAGEKHEREEHGNLPDTGQDGPGKRVIQSCS